MEKLLGLSRAENQTRRGKNEKESEALEQTAGHTIRIVLPGLVVVKKQKKKSGEEEQAQKKNSAVFRPE